MFSGYGTTLLRDMPGHAAYFMVYETVSKWLSPGNGQESSDLAIFAAGGSAGLTYWTSIYPLDLVKSRIQTSTVVEPFWTVFVREYQTSGIGGMYRGLGVTVPRAIISSGVIFIAYEYSKRFLDALS